MTSAPLLEQLESHNLRPLWTDIGQSLADAPRGMEPASHWKWHDLKCLADRAADEVSMNDAERRVLILANPTYGKLPVSTGTLIAAVQVLNPGELAEPHRHTIAALRIITAEDGGITTVGEWKLPMAAGDLILTPSWSWHGHRNDTDRRSIWIDVLDLPLVGRLDAVFFQHPSDRTPKLDDAKWCINPLSGVECPVEATAAEDELSTASAKKLRYPWLETKAALQSAPLQDGSRRIRYIDPATGEALMPTIDCYAVSIDPGGECRSSRTTASTVCYVVEGSGQSRIGGQHLSWSPGDIFTLPHWTWAEHRASSGSVYMIQVTNRGMLEQLGLLREEVSGS